MKTDTVLRQEGMEALITKLGYVDAERFIVLIAKEPFDYTKWRETGLHNDISVRDLSKAATEYTKRA